LSCHIDCPDSEFISFSFLNDICNCSFAIWCVYKTTLDPGITEPFLTFNLKDIILSSNIATQELGMKNHNSSQFEMTGAPFCDFLTDVVLAGKIIQQLQI